MQIHKTKYAVLTVSELLNFAEDNIESLSPLGQELLFRLEVLHSGGNGNTEYAKEFLERQQTLA